MLSNPTSFNGKLILEAYKHTEVRAEGINRGWVQTAQKNTLKGLKVLVDAKLSDGATIPSGSIAYIKEDFLHTCQWAKDKRKCETIKEEFILVNISEIEYIVPPSGNAA